MSGAGKSTVGSLLAARLGADFVDADGLHPAGNLAKLRAGVPLDEEDRAPWLDLVGAALAGSGSATVAACSALRADHRDRLRRHVADLVTVQLVAPAEVLAARLASRSGHFMAPSLLESQLAMLEPLRGDESGFAISVFGDPPLVVDAILERLGSDEDHARMGG